MTPIHIAMGLLNLFQGVNSVNDDLQSFSFDKPEENIEIPLFLLGTAQTRGGKARAVGAEFRTPQVLPEDPGAEYGGQVLSASFQCPSRLPKFAFSDAVEDDVIATRFENINLGIVQDFIGPQGAHPVEIGAAAHGRHPSAQMPRNLHRKRTH